MYVFAVSALAPTLARAGVDPVQFFTQETPKIIKKLESPQGTETYLSQDKFGNLFQLKLREPLSMQGEVGASLLAQGIELPSIPVYPSLIQKSPSGQWLKAIAVPDVRPLANAKSLERLTPMQKAEWLGQMIFNGILGNTEALTEANSVALSGEHMTTFRLSQAFRAYEKGGFDPMPAYLDRVPLSHLQNLSNEEASAVLLQLNRYLSRLEKVTPANIEDLFGSYFDAAAELRRKKGLPSVDYRADLARRIRTARVEVIIHLRKLLPQIPVTDLLLTPVRVGQPAFHMPSRAPREKTRTPEDRLWRAFFQKDPKLPREESQSISSLLEEACKRRDIYYVGPTLDPKFFDTEMVDPPQTHLNPKNSKTLVVVATNDLEAIYIARIAKNGGAHVMQLDPNVYPQGSKLSPALAEKVIAKAQELGVERVVVSELPEAESGIEDLIVKRGFHFFPIDHHDHIGTPRAQPYSSLEQAAQLLGYDLGGMSKIVEVNDRSHVAGLRELGLSKESVKRLFPPKVSEQEIANFPKFNSSRYGDFYIVKNYRGKFPELIASIALKEWPKSPNVLILGSSLRFSGNPKFREILTDTFREFEGQVGQHHFGGDAMRSQYWGLKGIPAKLLESVTEKALLQVEAALVPQEAKTFRDVLWQKLQVPRRVFLSVNKSDSLRSSAVPASASFANCMIQSLENVLQKK